MKGADSPDNQFIQKRKHEKKHKFFRKSMNIPYFDLKISQVFFQKSKSQIFGIFKIQFQKIHL